MKRKISFLIYLLSMICMIAVISGCSGSTEADTAGQTSADETELNDLLEFTAATADNEKITQDYFADYDVTVVNVWATFCPSCLGEMPGIAEMESTRPDNIGMLLICADALDEPDYMMELIETTGYKGINLVRGDGDFSKLIQNVQLLPTTVFVDSEGRLVDEPVIGASANPKMTYYKHVNRYLEEKGLETVS